MIAWESRPTDQAAARATLEAVPLHDLDAAALPLPPGQSEVPHGPCWTVTLDGDRRTLVWGPHVPPGILEDGPELASEPQAKKRRLLAGVTGAIGEQRLHVQLPRFGLTRAGRVAEIDLGGRRFTLRVVGVLPSRAALLRADGTRVADVPVRLGGTRRIDEAATPEEVVLAHLLSPTYEWLAPRI